MKKVCTLNKKIIKLEHIMYLTREQNDRRIVFSLAC